MPEMRKQARSLVKAKISDLNSDEVDDNFTSLFSGRLAKFKISGMSAKEAIERLKSHQAIEYVEPDLWSATIPRCLLGTH